jgi:branched-chain amino acid transport system substrate-binding protein
LRLRWAIELSVLLLTLTGVLFSCRAEKTGETYNAPGDETISIGVAYPASQWDEHSDYRRALDLAVRDVNQAGGVLGKPLSLVIRDDGDNARTAMQIAETFHDTGITAVVGHWSSDVCYYVEDIYEERGMIMLTPFATSRALFELDYRNIFRIIAGNGVYATAMAEYARDQGFRRMAIYYAENTYGSDIAMAMEQELARHRIIVIDRVTSISPVNVANVVRRWRAFGCDGLIIAADFSESVEPVKHIKDAGGDYPVFLTDGFDNTAFGEIMAGYTDNLYAVVYGMEDLDHDFLERYRKGQGHDPSIYEITGYAAVRLLADAMNACQSLDSAALSAWLKEIRNYPVVMGMLSYNRQTQEFDGQYLRIKPWIQP